MVIPTTENDFENEKNYIIKANVEYQGVIFDKSIENQNEE
jgi:hypothetical protein